MSIVSFIVIDGSVIGLTVGSGTGSAHVAPNDTLWYLRSVHTTATYPCVT